MNFIPLGIKTDYSLLSSLIKIDELFTFVKTNNIKSIGIVDNNLHGVINFYLNALKNNIKPIVGWELKISNKKFYLYVENYNGLQNLFKLNTYILNNDLSFDILKKYSSNLIGVVPYENRELYETFKSIYKNVFISFNNDNEYINAKLITENIVYINETLCLEKNKTKYINFLNMIKDNKTKNSYSFIDYSESYLNLDISDVFKKTTLIFDDLCDLVIENNKIYIPKYKGNDDNYKFLYSLALKGLEKRLSGNITQVYKERFLYELNVIKNMGFVDYFLIVYDYVKYAKQNGIYVGPGRGSSAGSLISYSLGITQIDPIKYDLLFERFLNPERITMPDIDIDFDASKRGLVIDYVRETYGEKRVAGIMTFGTMASKQVLRDIARCLEINDDKLNILLKNIDAKISLKDNMTNEVMSILNSNNDLKEMYKISMNFEGLKRQISTHAAGVVVSSIDLDELIPLTKSNGQYLTGYTMEFLENLGLLKMDFLAIKDLTILANTIESIERDKEVKLNLEKIDLDDPRIYNEFSKANTVGIFQFESEGMKNFLRKLKPKCFDDLIAALALFRPGPMQNIDTYIRRKEGKEKIDYYHETLKPILESTYGIIVYQEQIMQILNVMGNYSYAESDLIRRAISKKKLDIIESEEKNFINRSVSNGYNSELAKKIYDLIVKFANYGFNKSHSVAYSLIGYQMMYLNVYYKEYFIINLLNSNIGSESKTSEYLGLAKMEGIKILKPDVNLSKKEYIVYNDGIMLPLNVIKNIGSTSSDAIIREREEKGEYKDYFDFVARTYGFNVNKKILECLIYAGVLDSFKLNRNTMIQNMDNAINYAELIHDLDESLVEKPVIKMYDELNEVDLREEEVKLYGFHITNHPASKFESVVKMNLIEKYFDKVIKCVVLVENIKSIDTKNNKKMAFITGSDETGRADFVIFPNCYDMLKTVKKGELIGVIGRVERRMDKYQIVVNNLNNIKVG